MCLANLRTAAMPPFLFKLIPLRFIEFGKLIYRIYLTNGKPFSLRNFALHGMASIFDAPNASIPNGCRPKTPPTLGALSMEDNKCFLIEALYKNMQFVPYCHLDGREFGIGKADKVARRHVHFTILKIYNDV